MFKDLSFTFQKYSDQGWGRVGAFENNYVPDEIFAPVMAAIYSRAGDILKYSGVIDRAAHAASLRQQWSWPDVVGHTMRLWHELDPVRGDVFRKAEDDAAIRVTEAAPGKGGGMCFSDYIDFQRDFSLNDPVYLAHESGHLVAAMNGPDLDNNMLPWNMTEMPAFFMQERAYDDLRAHARDAEELRAVTLHRLRDYTSCLSRIPFSLWALARTRQEHLSDSLTQRLSLWSINDPATVDLYQRWGQSDHEPMTHKAQMMHTHPFSALLMIEFYQRFKKAEPEAQKQMLGALYDRGAQASLLEVLTVFGVHNEAELKHAAEKSCAHIADEIARCGFKPEGGLLSPQP